MANAHALHVGALGLIPAPHSLLSTSWNHLNQQARNSSKHYSIWPTNQNLQKTVNFFLWCKNGSRGQSGSLMGRALFTCAKPVFHCRFHIIPSPVPQSEEPCQLPPNPASSPSDLNSNNGLFFTTIIHYGPWMLSWAPKRAKSQHGSWDREHKLSPWSPWPLEWPLAKAAVEENSPTSPTSPTQLLSHPLLPAGQWHLVATADGKQLIPKTPLLSGSNELCQIQQCSLRLFWNTSI